MLWPLIQQDGRLLGDGWREKIAAIVASRGDKVACWYIADEPPSWGWSLADTDAVSRALPSGSCIAMSVDPSQIRRDVIPSRVSVAAVNAYSSHGVTPETVRRMLDDLYGLTGAVYLSLEAYSPGNCSQATEAAQSKAVALNRAMLDWSHGRNVIAAVGFVWRTEESHCGAADLGIIRNWVNSTGWAQ